MIHDYELSLLMADQKLALELERRAFRIYLKDSEKVTSGIPGGLKIVDRFALLFS